MERLEIPSLVKTVNAVHTPKKTMNLRPNIADNDSLLYKQT